jgi:hypothetical protein
VAEHVHSERLPVFVVRGDSDRVDVIKEDLATQVRLA